MFRSKLLWHVYAGYVAIVIISTFIVGVLNSRQISENGMQEIHLSLAAHTELLGEIAMLSLQGEVIDGVRLQQTLVQLGKNTGSRLTIIASDGAVLADSRERPENMDNHLQRPEIIDARMRGSSTTSRYSQTLNQQMIYRALRIDQRAFSASVLDSIDGASLGNVVEHNAQGRSKSEPAILGFVRVSLPLSSIDRSLVQLRLTVLFGAGISALAALLIGFYFAKRFSDPLVKMTEIAEAIAEGDYNRRISISQDNEIGALAKAFNSMARSSSQRMDEITTERNRLAMIFAGMVEGVIGIDDSQKILHINRTAARLLQLSSTECINQSIWEQVRVHEINHALEQAMSTNGVIKSQMRRQCEGNDQVVDIYVAVLCDEAGDSIGAVLVLNDISELDRLERIRRDFVANASHELKSPITVIRGLTETILDDHEMASYTKRRFTEKIHQQSFRLSALVSDLLTISRLESDHGEQNSQTMDLCNLINGSVATAQVACQEKELSLEVSLSEPEVKLLGDAQGISQLLDNLLDNAIKYTPSGGLVSIRLSLSAGNVQVDVKDSGVGISAEHQPRIFERFYRADKARSRELGGTGLGLSIVKHIAEQHGGSVSLVSQIGLGTCFTVMLPLRVEAASEPS